MVYGDFGKAVLADATSYSQVLRLFWGGHWSSFSKMPFVTLLTTQTQVAEIVGCVFVTFEQFRSDSFPGIMNNSDPGCYDEILSL